AEIQVGAQGGGRRVGHFAWKIKAQAFERVVVLDRVGIAGIGFGADEDVDVVPFEVEIAYVALVGALQVDKNQRMNIGRESEKDEQGGETAKQATGLV